MIIVVEIVSRAGTRACKEYGAPSYNAAIEAVKRELRAPNVSRYRHLDQRRLRGPARINGRLVNSVDRQKEAVGVG